MLTDTYTAKAFFDDFTSDPKRALRWGALRHDSGDPFEFIKMAKEAWTTVERKAGISRGGDNGRIGEGKMAVFSDSLDVERALKIQAMCDQQGMAGECLISPDCPSSISALITASFGIGTFLTNDFKKKSDSTIISTPLNIVIKLNKINGRDCVKLSDDVGKVCRALGS
jgi:nicotinate phosphoribosyltransferase